MPKKSQPWLRKNRGWWATIEGKQYELGLDKEEAFAEFYRLMQQPPERKQAAGRSFAAITDDFLDFVDKNKAAETFTYNT